MSALIARRCYVSGLVQGVFYRASTRQKAAELGIAGYATNLPDGRVEVLIVAEPAAAHTLIEWLRRGPAAAKVKDVEVHELDLEKLEKVPVGFATR
jgi:acylphosphatase